MALAKASPTITPPTSPGPAVAATPSSSVAEILASASAPATIASIVSTWARAAISGTTPPNGAWSSIWLSTTADMTSTRPSGSRRTTAAAVSSQLVSTPRTVRVAPSRALWSKRIDMTFRQIRIGTRGSKLALTQAGHVRAAITAALGGQGEAVLVPVTTSGDRIQNRVLTDIGGKALFTKEIEGGLLAGRFDCAVHSMKDMPAEDPPGLVIAAVPA